MLTSTLKKQTRIAIMKIQISKGKVLTTNSSYMRKQGIRFGTNEDSDIKIILMAC